MPYGMIHGTFKDAPNTVLMEDTDEIMLLCTTLNGIEYRFNCDWMTNNDIEWFAPIFEQNLTKCWDRACAITKGNIRQAWNTFMNAMQ